MNKNTCDNNLKYIYDKIWDLRKDAENKTNIFVVVLGIMISSLFLFFDFINRLERYSLSFWIVFLCILTCLTGYLFSLLFMLISLYPRKFVKIKEKHLKKLENIDNIYNYLYWIRENEFKTSDFQYQIYQIASITYRKLNYFKKIVFCTSISIIFEIIVFIYYFFS